MAGIAAAWLLGVSLWWGVAAVVSALAWLLLRVPGLRWSTGLAVMVFVGFTAFLVLLSGSRPPTAPFLNLLGDRSDATLAAQDPFVLLLLLGCGLVMISTGNGLVRAGLLLADEGGLTADGDTLRAGRIIGSLERLLILGFAVAGEPTAAALVISAKGLLRFQELREKRQSEYILVGSLLSWTVALGAAALIAFSGAGPSRAY